MQSNRQVMLFLFDVRDSTRMVHKANRVEQEIFYRQLEGTLASVVANIRADITIVKSTGDGYYMVSDDPDACLLLYVELTGAFESIKYKDAPLEIRCGAGYDFLSFVGDPPTDIRGDLANVTARCCSNAETDELIVTETLHSLVSSSTLVTRLGLISEKMETPHAKGCEDIGMWRYKKKLPESSGQTNS